MYHYWRVPDSWKYANVQPIYKKANRQLVNNYRPISLLPICGKILEKIVFDKVYAFFNKNNLISGNQSDLEILQFINFFLSLLLFTKSLKNTMKRAQFFLIFPKPLIRCGMVVSFSSWGVMVLLVAFFTFSKIICLTDTSGCFWTVKSLNGCL